MIVINYWAPPIENENDGNTPKKIDSDFRYFPRELAKLGVYHGLLYPIFRHSLAFNFSESQIGDWSTLLRRLVWLERELITDYDNSYDPSACCVLANVRLHFLDIFHMLYNPTVPVATSDHSSTMELWSRPARLHFPDWSITNMKKSYDFPANKDLVMILFVPGKQVERKV